MWRAARQTPKPMRIAGVRHPQVPNSSHVGVRTPHIMRLCDYFQRNLSWRLGATTRHENQDETT
jgi:hypothetical protein